MIIIIRKSVLENSNSFWQIILCVSSQSLRFGNISENKGKTATRVLKIKGE